jgi:tetratricopeptide (TPR) repeat protein
MRILAALWLALPLHGAGWIALRTGDLELYSDAGERTARRSLARLLDIARLLPPRQAPAASALRVFVFASEREYRRYAPPGSTGFHQTSPERDYIATFASAPLPRVVVHEYAHFALHSAAPRPAWLEEGLAEFYSNVEFTRSGARVGAPIPEHLHLLNSAAWLTPEEINQPRQLGARFYATAWALVHMLRSEPQYPEEITPAHLTRLRSYLRSIRAQRVALGAAAPPLPTAEPVSTLEALLLRGDFALRTGHAEFARVLFEEAARDFPDSAAVEAGRGALAAATGDMEAARRHLERAVTLDSGHASAWFQLALLTQDGQALVRAAELNPNLGEAHWLLGTRATDAGELDRAIAHLERAARLLPRKSDVWYSLAYAYWKRGETEAARAALRSALRTAATAEHRSMAETLLRGLL